MSCSAYLQILCQFIFIPIVYAFLIKWLYYNYPTLTLKRFAMKWENPSYTDLRFGFEVTMYILNR